MGGALLPKFSRLQFGVIVFGHRRCREFLCLATADLEAAYHLLWLYSIIITISGEDSKVGPQRVWGSIEIPRHSQGHTETAPAGEGSRRSSPKAPISFVFLNSKFA